MLFYVRMLLYVFIMGITTHEICYEENTKPIPKRAELSGGRLGF